MPEFQQAIQVSFHIARVGYHEGPSWEKRFYNPCTDIGEAHRRVREEFPESEYDVWDVSYDDRMVPRVGRPRERTGEYEKISLEVRRDLLAKMDASDKSRREYIEELLEQVD